jgi:DNA-binding transcriptional ArsR family regulator
MENIDDYLSNLSIESLMDLSETTSSSTFEENSIVRELISRFKLSQSNFTWGLIVLRDNILIEITKRYIQLNIKPMNEELTPTLNITPTEMCGLKDNTTPTAIGKVFGKGST